MTLNKEEDAQKRILVAVVLSSYQNHPCLPKNKAKGYAENGFSASQGSEPHQFIDWHGRMESPELQTSIVEHSYEKAERRENLQGYS